MKIASIISAIESFAPPGLQEKWDNTGLQAGSPRAECTGVLLCVDVTETVVEEASERGCNLIISHHPLIFRGLKSLTGATAVERTLLAAIRAGIAIYSSHTALDSTVGGVSYAMARMLGAKVMHVLAPAPALMEKITVYAPRELEEDVRLMMLDLGTGIRTGAGNIPDPNRPDTASCINSYAEAVTLRSPETSAPDPESDPDDDLYTLISHRALTRVETVVPSWQTRQILSSLSDSPLFHDLSVECTPLSNSDPGVGLGVYAVFDEPMAFEELLDRVKTAFGTGAVRCSTTPAEIDHTITRIALCGGSGGEFIPQAIRAGAQAYITADVRYHDFVDFGKSVVLMDIGHFESETCAKDIFYSILTNKFPNFAVYKSELEKNPVNYL